MDGRRTLLQPKIHLTLPLGVFADSYKIRHLDGHNYPSDHLPIDLAQKAGFIKQKPNWSVDLFSDSVFYFDSSLKIAN